MFDKRSLMTMQRATALRQPMMVQQSTRFVTFKEKERADEKAYFSKKDADLLKKLAAKLEAREELETDNMERHDAMCDDLCQIFEEHKLDKNGKHQLLYQELMEWKRHQH